MAFATGGTLGTGVSSTSAASFTLTTATNTLAAGDIGLLVVSTDNTATTDGDAGEHTSVSGGTGNWTKLGEFTNGNGAAAAGCTVSLWLFTATGAVAVGTVVTMSLASAVVDKAASFWKFTVGAGNTVQLSTDPASNPLTNATDGAAGYGSLAFSGLPSKERLYFRGLSKEANSTTQITPSTGFTAITAARSRNSTLAMTVRGEFRINTSTGETSNPTLAVTGDTSSVFVALEEVTPSLPPPRITQIVKRAMQAARERFSHPGSLLVLAAMPMVAASGPVSGDASVALPMLTAAAGAAVDVAASGTASIPMLTMVADGGTSFDARRQSIVLVRPLAKRQVASHPGSTLVQSVAGLDTQSSTSGTASLTLPMLTVVADGTVGTEIALPAGLTMVQPRLRRNSTAVARRHPLYVVSRSTASAALSGAGIATLPILSANAVGNISIDGTAAPSLPILTATAAATIDVAGAGAASLPILSAAGVGAVDLAGASSVTLPMLAASGQGGGVQVAQRKSITLSRPRARRTTDGASLRRVLHLVGYIESSQVVGTGAVALPILSAAAAGAAGDNTGDAAVALPVLTAAASGSVTVEGSGTAPLPMLTVFASSAANTDGQASLTLPMFAASAVATVEVGGASATTIPILGSTATATVALSGNAAPSLPVLAVSASGTVAITGTGATALPILTVFASTEAVISGDGAVVIPILALTASGGAEFSSAIPSLTRTITFAKATVRSLAFAKASIRTVS